MPEWHPALTSVLVIAVATLVAQLVDRRIARVEMTPERETRYRVLRRTVMSTIIAVGILSALLTLPAVRTIAGAILASSAVLALVVGLAAQSTLANFVAGILIAFSQPLRIGDRVAVAGDEGWVEEIGLTYTFIRLDDGARLVIPNAKLAADTIRNSSIVSREKVAEITVQIPLTQELGDVLEALRAELAGQPHAEVFVSGLEAAATVTVRVPAGGQAEAEHLERDLRLRAHRRLLAEGLLG
jgi:small-conductance mechanosensitive channel